jgi:hypothetical protein
MAFLGDIEDRLRRQAAEPAFGELGEGLPERCEDGGVIRLGATRRERAVRSLVGKAEAAAERAQHATLGLDRERAREPGRELRVVGRDERLGDDAHRRRGRFEEPEVARTVEVHRVAGQPFGCEPKGVGGLERRVEVEPLDERTHLVGVLLRQRDELVRRIDRTLDGSHELAPELSTRGRLETQHDAIWCTSASDRQG